MLSPSDVAKYGALCALASFDRQELQKNVISSRYVLKCNNFDQILVEEERYFAVLQIPIARSPEATRFSTGLPTLRDR